MARLAVILFGPPAAGKGTQARVTAAEFGFPVISTGDILRAAARKQSVLGLEAKGYMDAGALVPDSLVDAIVKERLSEEDCGRGFVLDGYPRTIHQAEFLEDAFRDGEVTSLVVGIRVPDEVLILRVASRKSCPKCGRVYGTATLGSPEGARCDECGAELVSRRDDSPEVMAERLEVYHRQTQPLIDYYTARGCYSEVDGDRPVDEVQRAILDALKSQRTMVR